MKMNDRDQDDLLEAAFSAARTDAMHPVPEALMARIAGDAETELAWRRARRPSATLGAILKGLGGWPGLGGLVTAAAVGVWIGVALPTELQNLGLPLVSQQDEDVLTLLLPDYTLADGWEG
jgi:hypothetical protein